MTLDICRTAWWLKFGDSLFQRGEGLKTAAHARLMEGSMEGGVIFALMVAILIIKKWRKWSQSSGEAWVRALGRVKNWVTISTKKNPGVLEIIYNNRSKIISLFHFNDFLTAAPACLQDIIGYLKPSFFHLHSAFLHSSCSTNCVIKPRCRFGLRAHTFKWCNIIKNTFVVSLKSNKIGH